MQVCRFAPSTTGRAHPGTLLAALLCWLDARSLGARLLLRLEDLDPERCLPVFASALRDDLAWLGLDWDEVVEQHSLRAQHEAALDRLAAARLLYPCGCSRTRIAGHGVRAPDGGWRYPNWCRGRDLPPGGWRACKEPLRARLVDESVTPIDESGLDLSQAPARELGDPIVRRRDGAVAYQLAVVVDDAASFVTRIVRGRDIAPSTATQVLLQRMLGLPTPCYRHHLLLLEARGEKLAKLHGAVGADVLRTRLSAPEVCGFLAFTAGLRPTAEPAPPRELLAGFSWQGVASDDRVVRWTGTTLEVAPGSLSGRSAP
jgi:glutamyl/glutaminyl-tRNA synthetase